MSNNPAPGESKPGAASKLFPALKRSGKENETIQVPEGRLSSRHSRQCKLSCEEIRGGPNWDRLWSRPLAASDTLTRARTSELVFFRE